MSKMERRIGGGRCAMSETVFSRVRGVRFRWDMGDAAGLLSGMELMFHCNAVRRSCQGGREVGARGVFSEEGVWNTEARSLAETRSARSVAPLNQNARQPPAVGNRHAQRLIRKTDRGRLRLAIW